MHPEIGVDTAENGPVKPSKKVAPSYVQHSFEEFVIWYLKYFNPDNEEDNGLDNSLVGMFYSSYNPQVLFYFCHHETT